MYVELFLLQIDQNKLGNDFNIQQTQHKLFLIKHSSQRLNDLLNNATTI